MTHVYYVTVNNVIRRLLTLFTYKRGNYLFLVSNVNNRMEQEILNMKKIHNEQ